MESDLSILSESHTRYPESPDDAVLETFENEHPERDYWIRFECPEFTALCPITGQPDFGTITIEYVPDKRCIESKALKLYLFSFRNQGIFHEAVVNRIANDILASATPRQARIQGHFNARGGIAIHVEVTHP